MTVSEWLRSATEQLRDSRIETARLDALVLLGDVLRMDKSAILAHPELQISGSHLLILNTFIVQRTRHTPLAYLRGHAEFYGRRFTVTPDTLIPRPESEAIIDLLLDAARTRSVDAVCDIGTGSGALAITAGLELPSMDVYASDISPACITVATDNARSLDVDITLLTGDLLKPFRDVVIPPATVVLANLPYVPQDYPINAAAAHEPELALFSGTDGLDHYRSLFMQLAPDGFTPLCIITESLLSQHEDLAALAASHGYALGSTQGLAQSFFAN